MTNPTTRPSVWWIAVALTGGALLAAQAVGYRPTLSVVVGALWALANFWCFAQLLGAWLGPHYSSARVWGWLAVKFPVLYLLAFAAFRYASLSVAGFTVGFTLILAAALIWFVRRPHGLHTTRPG